MKRNFYLLRATRELTLKIVQDLSLEQVNFVPPNFNNNIAWNVAHMVVTQQLLCYALSGNESILAPEFIATYKKGTKAEKELSWEQWEAILSLVKTTPTQLQKDYEAGLFKEFKTYPTSYGYELNSIEDAIQFNNAHEALHLGYVMSMKRCLV